MKLGNMVSDLAISLFAPKQLCSQLILNPVDKSYYQQISEKVMNLIEGYADVLEQASIDEAYLDCNKENCRWRK